MTTALVHSITDEQIAEIEDAAETRHGVFGSHFMTDITTDEVVAIIARLREAEKDAARLEFMISEQCVMQWQNGPGSPVVYNLAWPQLGENQTEWHATPRAAIDTAMQEHAK